MERKCHARGDKDKYTDKQKRGSRTSEEGYKRARRLDGQAERQTQATVNKGNPAAATNQAPGGNSQTY